MSFTPSRRDLFVRDVGRDARGSKPGMDGWIHQPDRFGTDAVGAAACPKTGVVAAAANVTSRRKFRCRTFMLSSLSWLRRHLSNNATPSARALERDARSGRASQEGFVELAIAVLASMYPAKQTSTGHLGHQCSHATGRPILHILSSPRRPRRERCGYVIAFSSCRGLLCSMGRSTH